MATGSDGLKKLPDSELEIMQILWDLAEAKKDNSENAVLRSEIEEKLADTHPIAMTTLLTLLTRLAEKGFVRIEKRGRKSVYIPVIRRDDYQAQQSRSFLEKVFGGNMSAFAAALQGSGISRDDIEELRRLLRNDEL